MTALLYWSARLICAFLAILLWGESARVTFTIFGAMFFEFFGLLALAHSPASGWVALQAFASIGLVGGLLLNLGKGRPHFWKLPLLAAIVIALLRLTNLFGGDWLAFRRTMHLHLAIVAGIPAGMLLGGAIVAGALRLYRARGQEER